MGRGRMTKERSRAALVVAATSTRPLLRTRDPGEPVAVRGRDLGTTGDRWIGAFLEANLPTFRRLDLKHDVCANGEPHVTLVPGPRIGAIPLLNPTTRKVAAGLLVEPRFRWAALGAVFDSIGFSVEPAVGGSTARTRFRTRGAAVAACRSRDRTPGPMVAVPHARLRRAHGTANEPARVNRLGILGLFAVAAR